MGKGPDYKARYGEWALVIGGSVGLGEAFARELARRGMNVAITARGQDRLDVAAQRLRDDFRVEVKTIVADLSDCAKVTLDIVPERFAEGRENFAVGTTARTRLDENFTVALARACAEGLLAKQPLVDPRSREKNTLFIANAPEANVALIYFDEGATWMEGPFFAGGQHVQVPGPDALKEAIYCHTIGVTPQEEETTGRCLPD